MTEQVHDITDLPKKARLNSKKIAGFAGVALLAAGVILLIDDKLKSLSKKDETVETPEA